MNKLDFTITKKQKCEEIYNKLMKDTIRFSNPIEELTRNIRKKEDSAAAMEFTKVICGILKENGVSVVARKYIYDRQFNKTFDILSENYGVSIERLDFSKHDKEFSETIDKMQSEIDRLQSEYAEALKKLGERQEKIKELESKYQIGVPHICVNGIPKTYSIKQLEEMAKIYEETKSHGVRGDENLYPSNCLIIHTLNDAVNKLQSELSEKQDEINSLSEQNKRNENIINVIDDILEKLFGVRHDVGKSNEFEKILKEKVENYKTISDLIPTEPIKVADMLINTSEKRTNCMTGKEYDKYIFEKWQLRQIAEHLLVYCNHNGEAEE